MLNLNNFLILLLGFIIGFLSFGLKDNVKLVEGKKIIKYEYKYIPSKQNIIVKTKFKKPIVTYEIDTIINASNALTIVKDSIMTYHETYNDSIQDITVSTVSKCSLLSQTVKYNIKPSTVKYPTVITTQIKEPLLKVKLGVYVDSNSKLFISGGCDYIKNSFIFNYNKNELGLGYSRTLFTKYK